jgi:nucleoside-diphosphate-sugar epimerase
MKVLVTGGTGFIGSHLVDSLLQEKNLQIYALIRNLQNKKWLEGRRINFLQGDLMSIPRLPKDIDFVFHLAGSTKARKSADYYTVNQAGSASLFKTLDAQGVHPHRLVILSSLAAAGPCREGRPLKESDSSRPLTPYGKSKRQGELEGLKFKERFPLVIARVGPVFGPRDRDFLVYFRFVKKGILPTFGSDSHRISICFVRDLIKALKLCAHAGVESGEIFNIGDPQPYTWETFGRTAARCLGKRARLLRIPLPAAYLTAFTAEIAAKVSGRPGILNRNKIREMREDAWVADMSRARERLGFRPDYSLERGLQETLDWYRREDWL